MGSFKSVNMIIALVWLYFAFTASVVFNTLNKPAPQPSELASTEKSIAKPMSTEVRIGRVLFKSNCASCHDKKMTTDLTGPALKGVTERWAEYPEEDLYSWIRNSKKLIAAEHPGAIAIAKMWDYDEMASFEHLSDEDISNLISYIER